MIDSVVIGIMTLLSKAHWVKDTTENYLVAQKWDENINTQTWGPELS